MWLKYADDSSRWTAPAWAPQNVHAEAISAVGDTGIRGFDDGTFRPHDNVTRGQTATFIARTILDG